MRKMKGAGTPVSRLTQWMFLIVISLFLIFVVMQWVGASEAALKNVGDATLVYVLTSSINSFSVVEKGRMEVEWGTMVDVEVICEEMCYMTVTTYVGGQQGSPSDEFLIIGNIVPQSLKLERTRKVCVEKGYEEPFDKVVIKRC